MSQDELQQVPNGSRPLGHPAAVPGVVMDRVNVAGAESGQQAVLLGQGRDPRRHLWTLDGVTVTDMAARGASPTYFAFDAFDQVQRLVGGNDLEAARPAASVISFANQARYEQFPRRAQRSSPTTTSVLA